MTDNDERLLVARGNDGVYSLRENADQSLQHSTVKHGYT